MFTDDWTPRAVIFDCDGLLVDTETYWAVAETELLARRGRTLSEAEHLELLGMSIPQTMVYLAERIGEPIELKVLESELLELVQTIVARDAGPMPGALAIVEKIAAVVPVAVASNSHRRQLDAALMAGNFDGRFAVTVAGDEIRAPKPAPDVYLAACYALGQVPSECLAFEDSQAGLTSAQRAGVRTIAVPSLPSLQLTADATFLSLEDPRLLAWIGGWAR